MSSNDSLEEAITIRVSDPSIETVRRLRDKFFPEYAAPEDTGPSQKPFHICEPGDPEGRRNVYFKILPSGDGIVVYANRERLIFPNHGFTQYEAETFLFLLPPQLTTRDPKAAEAFLAQPLGQVDHLTITLDIRTFGHRELAQLTDRFFSQTHTDADFFGDPRKHVTFWLRHRSYWSSHLGRGDNSLTIQFEFDASSRKCLVSGPMSILKSSGFTKEAAEAFLAQGSSVTRAMVFVHTDAPTIETVESLRLFFFADFMEPKKLEVTGKEVFHICQKTKYGVAELVMVTFTVSAGGLLVEGTPKLFESHNFTKEFAESFLTIQGVSRSSLRQSEQSPASDRAEKEPDDTIEIEVKALNRPPIFNDVKAFVRHFGFGDLGFSFSGANLLPDGREQFVLSDCHKTCGQILITIGAEKDPNALIIEASQRVLAQRNCTPQLIQSFFAGLSQRAQEQAKTVRRPDRSNFPASSHNRGRFGTRVY